MDVLNYYRPLIVRLSSALSLSSIITLSSAFIVRFVRAIFLIRRKIVDVYFHIIITLCFFFYCLTK